MSTNKLAIPRLIHFVAMLKQNRYPNHPKLVREMQKLDLAGAYSITQKTLQRDVAFLKGDYHAPIQYDYKQRGYYLLDPSWNWDVPALSASELEASLVGAQLAEAIIPAPLNKTIRKSVDSLLSVSEHFVQNQATLLGLIASGSEISISPSIFSEIYNAWKNRCVLQLGYTRALDGVAADLTVEPHILAFQEGCWYLKVKLLSASDDRYLGKDFITLAIHRVTYARQTTAYFVQDESIINHAEKGNIFDFPKIKNIRLKAHGKGLRYAMERFSPVVLTVYHDHSRLIAVPEAEEYKILNLVFAWPGEVAVVSPRFLRNKVQDCAEKVLALHRKNKKDS